MIAFTLESRPPLHLARIAEPQAINPAIIAAFERERDGQASRHSHLELGRYENTYIEQQAIPEVDALCEVAQSIAGRILGQDRLKYGFWFNAMQPGERTARHNHEEGDELLSCVYYLRTPVGCGDLLVYDRGEAIRITPEAGKFVFFSPKLAHEVERNNSGEQRLSVAFNFGAVG